MARVDTTVASELGSWIGDQIGVDKADVLGIDLHLHMTELNYVDVKMLIPRDRVIGSELVEQVQRYELKPAYGHKLAPIIDREEAEDGS